MTRKELKIKDFTTYHKASVKQCQNGGKENIDGAFIYPSIVLNSTTRA